MKAPSSNASAFSIRFASGDVYPAFRTRTESIKITPATRQGSFCGTCFSLSKTSFQSSDRMARCATKEDVDRADLGRCSPPLHLIFNRVSLRRGAPPRVMKVERGAAVFSPARRVNFKGVPTALCARASLIFLDNLKHVPQCGGEALPAMTFKGAGA
jgi:hypothetical protein